MELPAQTRSALREMRDGLVEINRYHRLLGVRAVPAFVVRRPMQPKLQAETGVPLSDGQLAFDGNIEDVK